MVGYGMRTREYRVWVKNGHKVIETSNLKFVKTAKTEKLTSTVREAPRRFYIT